ncbi:MAG: hypothetical protein JST67_07115 [Bacteroidetes bacterium]|nr:hypothetical protein [Bacteroidota bacterium]
MQLIKIRWYQIKRDLGWVFLAIVALCFLTALFFFKKEEKIAGGFSLVVIYALCHFHFYRKDIGFVCKNFTNPTKQLIVEYQLFLIPFSFAALFTKNEYCFFILQFIGLLIPFLNKKNNQKFFLKNISRVVPYSHFEWISGVRKNIFFLFILLVVALILSPVKLFGIIVLFLVNSMFFSFYTDCEPVVMLLAQPHSAQKILNKKIIYTAKNISIINIPLLIVSSVFNPDFILIHIGFLLYMYLLTILAVSAKYNSYKPNTKNTAASLQLAVATAALVFPPLAILTVFLCIKNYNGAITQLNFYLDDNY